MTFMAFYEILDAGWHIAELKFAAAAQFLCDILGHVLRPDFGGVERDHADRIAVVACQEVLHDCL